MNMWRVGHILLMLPRACVLHAARHPLDAALSAYAQPFAYAALPWAWDLGDIATQLEATWALADHWSAAAPGRVHTVLYEDVVARPEAALREALAACGLAFEPRVLRFYETGDDGGDSRGGGSGNGGSSGGNGGGGGSAGVHTASQAQVRRPLYKSAVGRWRRYARRLGGLRRRLAPLVARYERALADTEARRAAAAGGDLGRSTQEANGDLGDSAENTDLRDEL